MKKKKSEIFPNRPVVISDDAPLRHKVKVQRRSDILMHEQLATVSNLQDALQQSLDDADRSDNSEETAFHKDQTERLWMQLEEALMILKVMYKLNTELQYARIELEKSLKERSGEEVNLARKRVGWLEDRMERVIGKKRIKNPVRGAADSAAVMSDRFNRGLETLHHERSTTDFGSPMTERQMNFPTDMLESPDVNDTGRLSQEHLQVFASKSIMRQPSGKSTNRDSRVTIRVPEVDGESSLNLEPLRNIGDFKKPEASTKRLSDAVSSSTKSKLLGMLGVMDSTEKTEENPGPVDYWESEHHRFQHTEEADAICEVYPLSYHQMGLAVPGTFVEEIKRDPNLPWKKEKAKMSRDGGGYNEALQQISERIHTLYQRVSEAAMYSVTGQRQQKMTIRGLMGLNKFISKTKKSQAQPSISRILKRQESNSHLSNSLPELNKERIGSSSSGRLVFYPKPLPYPKNLPITRTKMDQVYPRDSEVFNSTDMDDRQPPKRLVIQHNLYNETKFTSSLFRSKPVQVSESQDENIAASPVRGESGKRFCTFKEVAEVAKAAVKFKGTSGENNWNSMKPKSDPLDHSGLKWERVKNIVHKGLISPFVEERIDSAKHLGALQCGDATVLFCLKERLKHDGEDRVRYEALKSLLALGCWEEEILAAVVRFMIDGNQDVRLDLIKAILNAKNLMFINKKLPSFAEVAKILSLLCMNENPHDQLSLDASICLGKMCISDKHGTAKLLSAIQESKDYNFKAEALEILVRQVNYPITDLIPHILNQLRDSPVWRYRKAAASLLIYMGKVQKDPEHQSESIYQECELALWNDPITDVRKEVTRAFAALGMYARVCEASEKKLEDSKEEIRAQGVISLSSLGVNNQRIRRTLVEMLELDSSDYVRILIMNIFSSLNMQDKRIMHALREKEKGEGPLARSARKTLQELNAQPAGNGTKAKKS